MYRDLDVLYNANIKTMIDEGIAVLRKWQWNGLLMHKRHLIFII